MTNTEYYYNSVRAFMRAFGQKRYRFISDVPNSVLALRRTLIMEEGGEYEEARRKNDKLQMLDGLCDLAYVVAGTMLACGTAPEPYTNKVQREPFELSGAYELLCAELMAALPCVRRMYKYSNQCLKLIEDAGSTLRMREAFEVVHKNNMDKLWPEKPDQTSGLVATPAGNKWLVRRPDGKIVKPPHHKPPNLAPFVGIEIPIYEQSR